MLTSGIIRNYKKGFVLDEDSLRRIQAVLEKEGSELGDNLKVVFYVEREDDRFYETDNPNVAKQMSNFELGCSF